MRAKRVNGSVDPRQDPTSIGNLAVAKGYATRDQVAEAAKKQEERLPLGEILVEQGVLTHNQLEELLLDQEIARRHLNDYEASKLVRQRKREKMREVSTSLRDVAGSIVALTKA